MAIRAMEGDLFDPEFKFDAIGHGVNTQGRMGAGIAKTFRSKYPEMYESYVTLCEYEILQPGDFYTYLASTGPFVLNLASQRFTGQNASAKWYAQALYAACSELPTNYSIGLPLIGAGIGGLTRQESIDVVKDISKLFLDLDFTIVELP